MCPGFFFSMFSKKLQKKKFNLYLDIVNKKQSGQQHSSKWKVSWKGQQSSQNASWLQATNEDANGNVRTAAIYATHGHAASVHSASTYWCNASASVHEPASAATKSATATASTPSLPATAITVPLSGSEHVAHASAAARRHDDNGPDGQRFRRQDAAQDHS